MTTLIEPIRVGLEESVRRVTVQVFWDEVGRADAVLRGGHLHDRSGQAGPGGAGHRAACPAARGSRAQGAQRARADRAAAAAAAPARRRQPRTGSGTGSPTTAEPRQPGPMEAPRRRTRQRRRGFTLLEVMLAFAILGFITTHPAGARFSQTNSDQEAHRGGAGAVARRPGGADAAVARAGDGVPVRFGEPGRAGAADDVHLRGPAGRRRAALLLVRPPAPARATSPRRTPRWSCITPSPIPTTAR